MVKALAKVLMPKNVLHRKLWRDLRSRKLSLLALIAIMAVGIGCFIGFAALWRDMDGTREQYYRDQQLADFTVDFKRAPRESVERIRALPNVREVRGRVNLAVLIDLPAQNEPISGMAISMPAPRRPTITDLLLRSGAWFSHEDASEVILEEAFAEANNLKPGDRLKVLLLDKQHELLVVGTAMSPEYVLILPPGGGFVPDPSRFGILYFPERFLQHACDQQGAFNQLLGMAHDNSPLALHNTLQLIEDELEPFGVLGTTPVQELPSVRYLSDELVGLKVSSTVTPTIFLGVAALVLNVVLSRLIAQQRTIIGTLRAVGYSPWAITRHFLQFAIIVGGLGSLAGVALAHWLQSSMLVMYQMFYALPEFIPHFYPDIIAQGVAIGVGFSLLGAIKGVRYAARLEPAEAIRPPPPEKGSRILPERIPVLWRRFSFREKMILRAVFRNPFRSSVSILASFIATALIVNTLSMTDSLDYLMKFEFERVSHQDVTVSLRDPVGRQAVNEMNLLPTITATEPQLGVPCDLINGPYKKRTGVTGLPADNRLYTPQDQSGRRIVIPSEGLILDRKLAEILHVKPGDQLRLRPLIAHRRETVAPVVGLVDSFLGISAYGDIEYLSRLLGEDWTANVLMSSSGAGFTRSPLLPEVKKRPTVVSLSERARSLTQLNETFGETMGAMLGIMVFFSGLIAFGSVLNATLVALSERRRDVGSLRVLGYAPAQVTGIFSGESYLLNGIGMLFGLLGGIGLTHLFANLYDTELYRFPAIVFPSRLLESAIIMLVFISIAQIIIYFSIRRLDWLEAVKIKE